MKTTLVVLTVLMHLLLTGFAFFVVKTVIKSDPQKLTKVLFVFMGLRFLFPLAFYAAWLFGKYDSGTDAGELKTFTIFFLICYLLFLAIDTIYLYCTLKQLDNNKK